MRRLNLRMFDGEGGGEGSAATGAEAAAPETTEGQQAEQTPEEREKAFNDMINGEFRFSSRTMLSGWLQKNMAYLQTRWAIFAKLWKVTMYSGKKPLRIRA